MVDTMRNRHKYLRVFILLVGLITVQIGMCQSLYNDYDFSTGINSSLWKDMTDATQIPLSGDDQAYTTLTPIGFNFTLANVTYQNWTINTNGTIRLGNTAITSYSYSSPLGSNVANNTPKIVVLGCDGYITSGTGYIKYKLFGSTTATRMLVIEYRLSTYATATRNYPVTVQIHIKESDRSITYVFGEPPTTAPAAQYQMGVVASSTDLVAFNTTTHTATFLQGSTTSANAAGTWPEQHRYYKLVYNPSSCAKPDTAYADNVTATSATIHWNGNANDIYRVCADGIGCQTVTGTSTNLTNLDTGALYTVSIRKLCNATDSSRTHQFSFRTNKVPAHGCITATDLSSYYITAYYGTFQNPYANVGIVDHGPSSNSSRHTIHTDTTERDPRTGNALRTVPPGHTSSVRLGNWSTGSQAEAILYEMEVDTNISDLMLLKYAAVLQDPNHTPAEQPRFRLEILNSSMQLIDPSCGFADFIANSNLGWNRYSNNLWKDWTTVGIDLSPYAGQTIYVRLTVYDCSQSGHYGYAYFTTECARKNMISENCGNITNNVFTAPSGFNYLWYTSSPQNPVSTQQYINVQTSNVIYRCRLSFIDNPSCNFEMSAYAGTRFPLALFDSVVTVDNCQFDVSFINRSTISTDGVNPVGTNESCETAWWDFGNGTTSTQYNPTVHYNGPGQYTVTLVSSIAGGTCLDTLTKTITLVSMPDNPPIIEGLDDKCADNQPVSLILRNVLASSWTSDTIIVNPQQTTTYTATVTDSNSCPQIVSHTITIHPLYDVSDSASICANQLPYTFADGTLMTVSGNYDYHYTSTFGCDSTGHYVLTVRDTTTADTLANACDHFTWYGTDYTTEGDVATRVTPNSVGCDSTTTLHLTLRHSTASTYLDTVVENQLPRTFNSAIFNGPVNHQAITITNAAGCDSIIDYSLHVWPNVVSHVADTVCDDMLPYSWNGVSFSSATTQNALLATSHGADSTVVMTLRVNPTYSLSFPASICDNQSTTFEGITYTAAGSYPHPFVSSLGCDSVRTLQLSVRATTTGDTSANVCDHFTWYGTDYTTEGDVATRVTPNSVGCDSTTTLHLTLRHSTASTYLDTVVENQLPRTFNSTIFNGPVNHQAITITNAAGCDSTIDYSLHVYWNRDTNLYHALCNDLVPFTWSHSAGSDSAGALFDTTVAATAVMTRTVRITTLHGADSTITMHLTVYPLYDHHSHIAICDNQTYHFGDSTFSGSNGSIVHLDSLKTIHQCDSLSTLHLTVNPTFDHHLYDTVCGNVAYPWGTPMRNMLPISTVASGYSAPMDTLFTDHLTSVHSCDSLSTLHLRKLAAYDIHLSGAICDDTTLTFENVSHHITGTYPYALHTSVRPGAPLQCDSTRTLHLQVYPTYNLHFYDTIYDGDTYSFEGIIHDTTGVYPFLFPAVFGCDSLRTLHLQRNRRTYIDSTICQNSLPLTWHHLRVSDTLAGYTPQSVDVVFNETDGQRFSEWRVIKDSIHLLGRLDIDSLVVMTLTVRDTSSTVDVQHACDSLLWRDDSVYRRSTDQPWVLLQNHWGCDSVRHLDLTIDHTHYSLDNLLACDSLTWRNGITYFRDTASQAGPLGSFSVAGPVDSLITVGGCDSVVTLNLAIHYSTYGATADTFCYDQRYNWHGQSIFSDATAQTINYYLTDTLQTVWHCDSVVGLHLTKMARPSIELSYDIDCGHQIYNLNATTDVGYTIWTSADTTLDGQELERLVYVSPAEPSTYYLYADYHEDPLCPVTDSIHLKPVVIPTAEMRVNAGWLDVNDLDFDAYDLARNCEKRIWYIDWVPQPGSTAHLSATAPAGVDSFCVALSIYNGQCWDTAIQVVPIRQINIFAPNVFTPGAATNNRFIFHTVGVTSGELSIYTRGGLLVFRTEDFANEGWDGGNSPQGSYVWVFRYHSLDRPESFHVEKGTVLLLR